MFIKATNCIFNSKSIGHIHLFDKAVRYFDMNNQHLYTENFNSRTAAQERFDELFKMLDKSKEV